MNDWQTIDTAPRDGSQILGSDGEWVKVLDFDGDDWYQFGRDNEIIAHYPIHWMPRPKPPSL